jgi:hypothetical protein
MIATLKIFLNTAVVEGVLLFAAKTFSEIDCPSRRLIIPFMS